MEILPDHAVLWHTPGRAIAAHKFGMVRQYFNNLSCYLG
jgi:hypothetical protein